MRRMRLLPALTTPSPPKPTPASSVIITPRLSAIDYEARVLEQEARWATRPLDFTRETGGGAHAPPTILWPLFLDGFIGEVGSDEAGVHRGRCARL